MVHLDGTEGGWTGAPKTFAATRLLSSCRHIANQCRHVHVWAAAMQINVKVGLQDKLLTQHVSDALGQGTIGFSRAFTSQIQIVN